MKYCNIYFYSNGIYGLIEDSIYSAKKYTYRNSYDYKLKVGDRVIVHINDKDVAIGVVINVFSDKDYSKFSDCNKSILKHIIGIANVDKIIDYHKKQRRLAEIDDQIEKMYKKVSKIQILETMCKDDKDMQNLLKEYKELTKG
jgi:primosomal protein N'